MASSDPTIRLIEKIAADRFPRSSDDRFKERNRLRAEAGLPAEKHRRGGLAGVYDRNKQFIAPVLTVAGAAVGAPIIGATLSRASRLLPTGAQDIARSLVPVAQLNPTIANLTSSGPSMPVPLALGAAFGAARSAATSAAAGAVTTIATGLINRFLPPVPNSFGPQGGIPQPKEGIIGRTISRIIPGGMTGREWTPATDLTDKIGRPLAVHPAVRESVVGPAGYVVVNYNGQAVAMLRSVAIRAGLYRPPPKPPISGWDLRAINRAASAQKRVKKLAGKVGLVTHRKGAMHRVAMAFGKKAK